MKAKEYIEKHPKSMLAQKLQKLDGNTEIIVSSGLISHDPRSNLTKLLLRHNATNYVVGGRAGQRRNDGYHFAVIIPS